MHKNIIAFLVAVPLMSGIPVAALAQEEAPPEVSLRGSQLHQFRSKDGREFFIGIKTPREYEQDTDVDFPVLYVLDGRGPFLLVTETYNSLRIGNEIPSMIIIGIVEKPVSAADYFMKRKYNFTPTRVAERSPRRNDRQNRTGGADKFLAILTGEILPWVEARYRTSTDRGLAGFSLGGLFATHVLFTAPDSFTHFLIGSPSLWWDNEIMFEREQKFSEESDDLSARVFLSVGSLEDHRLRMVSNAIRMAETLKSRDYKGLQIERHLFEGETHLSVAPATYSRGLRSLFGRE